MKPTPNVKISQIMGKLWESVRPHRTAFFVSYILFFSAQMTGIIVPLYYKKFFDTLGSSADHTLSAPLLVHLITIILLIHVLNWLLYRIGMYIYNKMQLLTMARIKQNSFDYMMFHSYTFFANSFSGGLVQKVNRFSRAFEAMTDSFAFNIMQLLITVCGAIIITWFILPVVSIVMLVYVIVFSTFNILFSKWKLQYDVISAEADTKTSGYLADAITNNNAVSFFTGQEFESDGFKEVSNDQAKKTRFTWQLGEVIDATQAFFILFIEFLIFYFAIKYWSKGLITIGTFVLAQTYIIGLTQQLWGLNRIIRQIYQSIADSKEMVEILVKPYEIQDAFNAQKLKVSKGEIDFNDVTFNFNENRDVLKNVNVTIHGGEKIAIIGHSGAGKTTFVRLIMRLYDITGGHILIDRQDIAGVTQDSLREQISLVPQDPVLFHRTLMENIRYGRRDATDDEVREAARLAHCDEFIDVLPLKYETFVGERGIKLSGGERQRVAIARAILKKAPILILDEATSSLDSHSESLIQDALDTLMRNCTTIVIAHRLSTIKKMDRIIGMKNGQIIEQGTHEELSKKEGGLYHKLWNLQVSGFIQE